MNPHLLARVLYEPGIIQSFGMRDFETLLALSERAKLTASLGYRIAQAGWWDKLPSRVRERFCAAQKVAAFRNRQLVWEMEYLERVFKRASLEVIALKGGAYLLLGMPWAWRRLVADLDILVAREQLAALEQLLLAEGFEPLKLSAYDQRYYREWMHELPPLRHSERQVEVDVHHALLPLTARQHADVALLWSAARAVPGSCLKVLGPEDMVIHAAIHLFYDSDLNNRLRDLLDIDELLRWFSTGRPDFWPALINRAKAHGLERALSYALYYSRLFLGASVPENLPLLQVHPVMQGWMDFLVSRALFPQLKTSPTIALSRWLLYSRSHYLRMPLRLLLPHLLHQAVTR